LAECSNIGYDRNVPKPKLFPGRDRGSQLRNPQRINEGHLNVWIDRINYAQLMDAKERGGTIRQIVMEA
jgi:hypothetical protein